MKNFTNHHKLGTKSEKLHIIKNITVIRMTHKYNKKKNEFNPLNAKLNPTCHLPALLGAHHILHISRIRVNMHGWE
jgi:hypothetical protein